MRLARIDAVIRRTHALPPHAIPYRANLWAMKELGYDSCFNHRLETDYGAVLDQLAAHDATDIVVFGGGIIPADDVHELEAMGVAKIFTPGATTASIVDWVVSHVGAAA